MDWDEWARNVSSNVKGGIETYGYRRNFAKACEAADSGYITAVADSLKSLVQVVKSDGVPGIFQLVIPAELVEDTINDLLPLLGPGDIVIDHGNSNFETHGDGRNLADLGIEYIDCGTSGGVYGLDRGYCLMVGGINCQYPLALQSLGHSHQVSGPLIELTLSQSNLC